MATTIIHIQWEGPYSLSMIKQFTDENIDYGVYQVYGFHSTYGSNVLLYIGKTRDQTFAKRVAQENWEGWEMGEGKVHFYIGRLAGSETPSKREWNRQIDLVEALLISAHKPAHNKVNVGNLSIKTDQAVRDVHVLNWGDRCTLLPEVSGSRWSYKFDDPPQYAYYGNHKFAKYIS